MSVVTIAAILEGTSIVGSETYELGLAVTDTRTSTNVYENMHT